MRIRASGTECFSAEPRAGRPGSARDSKVRRRRIKQCRGILFERTPRAPAVHHRQTRSMVDGAASIRAKPPHGRIGVIESIWSNGESQHLQLRLKVQTADGGAGAKTELVGTRETLVVQIWSSRRRALDKVETTMVRWLRRMTRSLLVVSEKGVA